MAESPLSLAAAPSAPAIVPPPMLSEATVPPPLLSQPNASSDPPALSPPTQPASPPLSAPPPSVSAPPPAVPASPPPTSPPLPSASPPPPDSTNAPPPVVSSPPPSQALPPPPTSSPSLSPPPSSPPPPPPVTISPPPPDSAQSPPPPDNAQSPPSAPPPSSPSQPPPSAQTPPLQSPSPPSSTPAPPSDPSAPPPKNAAPTAPSPPSADQSAPPPKNAAPTAPSPPSPPPSNIDIPSPQVVQSPAPPSIDPNKPPDASQNATAGTPDRTFHGGSGIKTGAVVPIVLVAGLFMLSLLGFAVWYMRKRRRRVGRYNAGFVMPSPYSSSQYSETSLSPTAPLVYNSSGAVSHGFMNSPGMGNSKSCFTYAELHKITDGFSSNNLLGEGGFGCVYKGCFADGREVAVKQLKVGGGQGEREFAAEVEIISRVHHRHLVSLVGYCIADKQRLLVYDFVRNDTLDYHLHGQGGTVLSWVMRVKIAAGAARGIAYLHEDCHPRIIHRDIKSSNILLDSNFEAQVSDFGLARLAMDAETHITTRVMGTFGYLAPEYASSGKLTDRSDVYSFGVVLLELITGRKPVDQTQPIGEESLVEWARPLMTQALDSGDFGELPDARLENNYNENEMFRMIEAAAACVRHSAAMRPKMGLVVRALDTLTDTDINNGVIPGQSELFAAPQSAEIRMFQRMAFGSHNFSDGFTRSSWMSRTESETASEVP